MGGPLSYINNDVMQRQSSDQGSVPFNGILHGSNEAGIGTVTSISICAREVCVTKILVRRQLWFRTKKFPGPGM